MMHSSGSNNQIVGMNTPGWNDPPINRGANATDSKQSRQRSRRPVDPSILVSNGPAVAAAGHGGGGQVPSANVNNMLSPQHQISHFPNHDPAHQASQQRGGSAQYLAPNFHQALPAAQITGQHHHNFHTSQSFPQLHHMGNIGGHSQAATNMLLPVGVDLPQQNIIPPPSVLAHPQPMLNMPLREIKNEVPSPPTMPPSQPQPIIPSPQQPSTAAGNNQIPSMLRTTNDFHHSSGIGSNGASNFTLVEPSTKASNEAANLLPQQMNFEICNPEADPHQAVIFSPPNSIQNWPDQRPPTQPDPSTYRPPRKAAGDVSLSGAQLVAFLTKATFKLQQGPTREGIQLRLGQFDDLVKSGQLSEHCIKKLNFIVDAIDRESYDEAWTFYEQTQEIFPMEMTSGWAHGIRILIQELRSNMHHIKCTATGQQMNARF